MTIITLLTFFKGCCATFYAMPQVNLLIVSDDPLARAGLGMLLAEREDCHVTGQMSGVNLLEVYQDEDEFFFDADVIIWDLGWDFEGELPKWNELDKPIVALVPDEVETAVFPTNTPTSLLSRSCNPEHIIAAANTAMLGLITYDPNLNTVPYNTTTGNDLSQFEELTPRELQVVQLIAEGNTNKAIAQQLNISTHTVKFHVNAIMNKLAAQSRTEAVVKATRIGLISL